MSKRTELHCHTKMSQMAGLVDVRELIQKARQKGVSAIAITDNDVVQSFPDVYRELRRAENAGKKLIKVIYGIEAWICDNVCPDKKHSYRAVILTNSEAGIRNLNELISESNLTYYDTVNKVPIIPRSLFVQKREGLIIGSCADRGEITRAVFENASVDVIRKILESYDYTEIAPVDNYIYPLGQADEQIQLSREDVIKNIKRIVELGHQTGKPVVGSSDVYYINKSDIDAFRVLRYSDGFCDPKGYNPKHYLMSTREMLKEFDFLGSEDSYKVVLENPCKLAERISTVSPISLKKNYPEYPQAAQKLKDLCYEKAHELYGKEFPEIVMDRLERELNGICKNGFATLYMIAHDLVKNSNDAGYMVGTRGSAGASFVAFLAGITSANPLPPHYICHKCGHTDFSVKRIKGFHIGDAGADLPDKKCPECGKKMLKEGFDIPVETFLGFHFDKEPDFDLNFAVEYQETAQKYLGEIDGVGAIFHAGTIGTFREAATFVHSKQYFDYMKSRRAEKSIAKVAEKLDGVKVRDGLHPGGIIPVPDKESVYAYSPIIRCERDDILSLQMDYHSIDSALLKIDILGHDMPSMLRFMADETGVDLLSIKLEDKKVMSLFSGIKELDIEPDWIGGVTVGTLGIPEFGNKYVRKILEAVRPDRFSDLIRVLNVSHGTNTWIENAEELITSDGLKIHDCISSRDDIMLYLIEKGMKTETAFKIMESVRKGKARYGFNEEWKDEMAKIGVPEWYIKSCQKIWYLFPKAHSVEYLLMLWRIAYFKVYYPESFYRAWLKYSAEKVDRGFIERGYEHALKTYKECVEEPDPDYYESCKADEVLVVLEMYARGVKI